MSFRLVLKSVTSMTLNGVIALTSPNRGVSLPNSVAYVKVVEDTLILSAAEMWAKNIVLAIYYLLRYSRGLQRTSALRKINAKLRTPNIYILSVQRASFPYWEFGYGKSRLTITIMELCFLYIICVNCVYGV